MDDKMEPRFDSLPGKVVEKVLYYLDATDREKFRLISKLWNKTITNLYSVTLRVHNINLELMLACEASSITGYFQSLTLPIPMNDTGTNFLSRLTSLTFTGVIVCYNIFPVFEQCQQIRNLEFIKCILNQNTMEHKVHLEDPSKLLPSLRALVIKLRYSPFTSSEINFFKRLLPFFTSEPGKLDTIVLDCPSHFGGSLGITFDRIFQKETFDREVYSMDKRKETIRMKRERQIADEFYNPLIVKNVSSLRNLEMADGAFACTFKLKFSTENEKDDFSNVQLSEFEQMLYSYDLSYKFFTIADRNIFLTNFLRHQTRLTKLSVTESENLQMNQVYTIAGRNADTLKSLTISFIRCEMDLDCASLTRLHVLQNLKLLYLPMVSTVFSVAVYARIQNLNHLPSSLRTFSTNGSIQFENEDDFNMAAFQHLQKLETLEILTMPFFVFGTKWIYEMEPQRIRQLISWLPSLKKLVLKNIPNIQFQHIGLIMPPPEHPFTDSLPDSATDWINNESGLSFQKHPIVIESLMSNENYALIGKRVGWETVYLPNKHPFTFPVHFDGVILIQPEYRRKTSI